MSEKQSSLQLGDSKENGGQRGNGIEKFGVETKQVVVPGLHMEEGVRKQVKNNPAICSFYLTALWRIRSRR